MSEQEPCPTCGRSDVAPGDPVQITSKLLLGGKELNLLVSEVNRQNARAFSGEVVRQVAAAGTGRTWRLGRFFLTYRRR